MSYETFAIALRRTFIACSAGQKEPDPQTVELYWSLFGEQDMPILMAALKAHVLDAERGRFPPRPADITFQLQQMDGHPSADEAWAIAVHAHDERNTVVWTGPMSQAWNVARHLYERTPAQAAVAFKESYANLVRTERASGARATWTTSLGHDKHNARAVIAQATESGRLRELGHEEQLLIEGPSRSSTLPEKYRERWNGLVAAIKSRITGDDAGIPADLQRTIDLKARAQAKYEAATKGGGQ